MKKSETTSTYKSQSVKLSGELIRDAEIYGKIHHRSKPSQIEHWAKLGKIAEENPELPLNFIQDIIISHSEIELGAVTPFVFSTDQDSKKK